MWNIIPVQSIYFCADNLFIVLTCRLFQYLLIYQDEDLEALLAADFEIGHFIRERIVPRAVLYFTGEALEQDDDVSGSKVL